MDQKLTISRPRKDELNKNLPKIGNSTKRERPFKDYESTIH
jgi:hypothetical protein